ncbi:MAG: S8 family serine peptidase, partial [Gammaproteobacteria bacterium]|nr:S8 family serine peptidase [Gammaproteobacteria bacterium]
DDHGNTASTATTLSLNSNRTGSIETSGDKDVFAITLSQTGTLTVRTTGSTDTSGLLFDASQTFIQADGDSGSGSNFQIVEPSLAAGQYYLEVTAFQSATGPYTVHADFNGTSTPSPDPPDPGNDDHGSTIADATPIEIGQSESGVIEQSGDADVFSVQISQSGSLTTYSSGSTDTVGRLLNSDGTARAEDDDGGNGQNFRIQTNVDPGTYYVEVKGYGGTATGSYSIQTDFISTSTPPDPADPPDPSEDDHGDTIAAATPIEIDQSVSGVLEHSEDTDVFSLQIAQLGTLTAYTSSNIDTLGRLLDSDGLEVAQDDDGGQSFNFRIQTDVTPGTYYIEVRGYGGATGSYNIQTDFEGTSTPSDPPDPPESSDDDHGDTPSTATLIETESETGGEIEVSGVIEISGDIDYFEIEFPSIGDVTIYTTGTLDTVGELQDSSGSSIASNDDGGEGRNFLIQEDVVADIYYIKVTGYGTNSGTYTLHLDYNSHGLDPSAVILAVSASSVDEHDRHRLTITATTQNAVIQDERLELQFSGTATQEVDYEVETTVLMINQGETQGSVELTPLRDWIKESDETVTIEVAVENSASAPSATVTINDLFKGEGTTYQTVNHSDLAVRSSFHEIENNLWVDATAYNLGLIAAIPGNLVFSLYRGNALEETELLATSYASVPQLDSLHGRYTSPFKIDLADLDADTQYTGLVSVSELTDEPLTENNRKRFGFELDSEGNLVTMCSAPTLNTSSAEADPLSRFQWHLHENPTLLSTDWTIEENAHLHISDTLAARTTGAGVKIALLDTGVETCHPELRDAISQQDSTETNALFNSSTTGDHGTALAGLIVAEANNGIGGQGIAPGAEILGFNYLQNQNDAQFAQGLGLADSVDPDLAIVSLGFSSLIPEFSDDSMPDLLATGTKLLRDGRGMVYVKASGDAFERCNRIGHPIHTELGCHSATTDPLANSPYVVVTGAFDSTAHRASYSNSGSNLWIVAPAGSNEDNRAGVITTDQFGEPRGYASTLPDLLNSR